MALSTALDLENRAHQQDLEFASKHG